ncbi:hypothetical protein [Desulfitobacterium sp. LBE]|uniref:hypothetical protein n=1 Tax=Desulfitobacterium sp. LBE TaxID=884086 RepID=UPI00155B0BFF|nr:hypothetical protein [Desulfitobacterium sp. LBE]
MCADNIARFTCDCDAGVCGNAAAEDAACDTCNIAGFTADCDAAACVDGVLSTGDIAYNSAMWNCNTARCRINAVDFRAGDIAGFTFD